MHTSAKMPYGHPADLLQRPCACLSSPPALAALLLCCLCWAARCWQQRRQAAQRSSQRQRKLQRQPGQAAGRGSPGQCSSSSGRADSSSSSSGRADSSSSSSGRADSSSSIADSSSNKPPIEYRRCPGSLPPLVQSAAADSPLLSPFAAAAAAYEIRRLACLPPACRCTSEQPSPQHSAAPPPSPQAGTACHALAAPSRLAVAGGSRWPADPAAHLPPSVPEPPTPGHSLAAPAAALVTPYTLYLTQLQEGGSSSSSSSSSSCGCCSSPGSSASSSSRVSSADLRGLQLARLLAAHEPSGSTGAAASGGPTITTDASAPPAAAAVPAYGQRAFSEEDLPERLRELVVPADEVDLLTWQDGRLQELGSGSSGRVVRAIFNGEVVAAKLIELGAGQASSQQLRQAFIREALCLQALRHPSVVCLMGLALTETHGGLLTEYCPGRDLFSSLDVPVAGSSPPARLFAWQRRGRRVSLDLAGALNHLHSRGVVHMDVKSSNVLLTASGAAKLADVGLARLQRDPSFSPASEHQGPRVGTFSWAAPELLLGAPPTPAADMFSFGVCCWEIVTGEAPGRGLLRMPRVPEECPQDICDLLMACLSEHPSDRPTAKQALHRLSPTLARTGSAPSVSLADLQALGHPLGCPGALQAQRTL